MELSVIYSRALAGIEAPLVQVETHLSGGLPCFHIVGLPETAVRESRERVRSAILNSHFDFPDRRITVNLAPADLPKEGGRFDLPIALGILVASGQLPGNLINAHEFLGELALDGSLRAVPGVIPAAQAATGRKRALVLPPQCAPLATHAPDSTVIAAPDLLTLCAHLNQREPIRAVEVPPPPAPPPQPDLEEIIGQEGARRALEIAACGGHNLLLFGPPGTGKTLLASRLPGILPPPDVSEALEGLALHSICGWEEHHPWFQRPFRSPHHSASPAALIGGGSKPRPGEVSLAHGGVLFLDELPEFSRHALEMLREPLESGRVTISRAHHKITYPSRFQLIAAMNPCPCGYAGDREIHCQCSPDQVKKYRQRVSGPLLDRIDMHVPVSRIAPALLLENASGRENSRVVRRRVCQGRQRQLDRQNRTNAQLAQAEIPDACGLDPTKNRSIEASIKALKLSPRALHRSLRVARTIADLAGEARVSEAHLGEAFAYRNPGLGL